jgi:hypothetical protein
MRSGLPQKTGARVMGRRFTWVIVAGVGALLLFAGLDALRSSAGSEDSAPGGSTSTTTAAAADSSDLLPCDVEDLRISIELRGGSATLVARNFGEKCYRLLRGWHLRIEDRAGDPLAQWDVIQFLADGIFPAGSESSFLLARDPLVVCKSGGPYLVSVTVGPYFARRHFSDSALGCRRTNATEMRQEIERIGNSWAGLFASFGGGSCEYQTQPLCERIACTRVSDTKIRNCTPPTRAFRRSFEDATVEDVVLKGGRAAARFSNRELVLFVFATQTGTWLVHKLGENAGRGFFE